jgi:hypothetical protein
VTPLFLKIWQWEWARLPGGQLKGTRMPPPETCGRAQSQSQCERELVGGVMAWRAGSALIISRCSSSYLTGSGRDRKSVFFACVRGLGHG